MAVNPSALGPKPQIVDSAGEPYVGGRLFFYVAGSVGTKQDTYTDSTGVTANTNPVVLNSLGEPSTQIWWTAGLAYKVVLAPPGSDDPPSSPVWTIDNLRGINDTSVGNSQWVDSGVVPTYVSGTQFTLAGDQTNEFQVGRRCKFTVTAGTVYGTITVSAYGVLTTVTVLLDSGALDSGLSAVQYGLLSKTNPSIPTIAPSQTADFVYAQGRLTLTTGVPVTTSDVTAATTVYFTPYQGNLVSLFDGTDWVTKTFTELSQATSDTTKSPAAVANNSNYDLFVWNDSGTLRCTRGPAWSSDTARGTGAGTTELEVLEGRYVNKVAITNGPAAQRGLYVGTIRSDGSAQINDSLAKRHVWNNYNRVDRAMQAALETAASWSYTTATIRQANANTANQLDCVRGLDEDEVFVNVEGGAESTSTNVEITVLVGLDSTNSAAANCLHSPAFTAIANSRQPTRASWRGLPGIGRRYLTWLEYSAATGTTTWSGQVVAGRLQTGISGGCRA